MPAGNRVPRSYSGLGVPSKICNQSSGQLHAWSHLAGHDPNTVAPLSLVSRLHSKNRLLRGRCWSAAQHPRRSPFLQSFNQYRHHLRTYRQTFVLLQRRRSNLLSLQRLASRENPRVRPPRHERGRLSRARRFLKSGNGPRAHEGSEQGALLWELQAEGLAVIETQLALLLAD